jgi:membrane fusion protein (multidrug efflux system)
MYRSLILIALFGFLVACKEKKGAAPAQRRGGALDVDGFIVLPHSVSEDVEVPGSLLPMEETQIKAEVSGRIVQLNIQEGTSVKRGDLLVKLFDADLQASLRKLQVQLEINQKTVDRQRDLLAINGISQQDFDLSALAVDNLKADIETTKIAISKTEIRAPYDGKLGLRNVSLGAYVSPSDIITSIRQASQLKLEFAIPEKYAKNISVGYQVKFRTDGGSKDHSAKVIATEGSVDQATRTLRVRALVRQIDNELVPGVFAKVNLQLGFNAAALMVPTQAILPGARSKQVVLLRKDSAFFSVVETGVRDSSYIQILRGVKSGDTVVTTGLMSIRPKAKLRIHNLSKISSGK